MFKKVKMCFAMSVMILCLSGGVLAGHTRPGGEVCTCGCAGCFCDPGEQREVCANLASQEPKAGVTTNTSPVTPDSSGDGGALLFGSLMLMALARFLLR